MKRKLTFLLSAVIMFIMIMSGPMSIESKAARVLPFTSPLDYSLADNWLYDGAYPENEVDVFMVAPSVDTRSEGNCAITPEYKKIFRYAMNQQQAIYAETARIYAPYYRQAALKAYSMEDTAAKEQVFANAYKDVSAAFKYYLEHKNNGRPLILAGFSQGADMCYRLLEEYYGGDSERAVSLRANLIAVYAIGWRMTEDMVSKYPQIVPAKGETDTGVVISYECEDGNVQESITISSKDKALSINPLNWRTDSRVADKSLNKGSVGQDSKTGAITKVEVGKYGAYIDPAKGSLIVTGIDTKDYPAGLSLFPEGSLHLYDNFLFFVNLQENVKKRTASFIKSKNASNAA
ncbi:DUF3089 domain-containing protein [Butyrivibrio sp. DSM 10294]|jgi:hypothetical protein|nr:DUF3089 domain-containing protein [Butyrivibrio sp. DSM 10294]